MITRASAFWVTVRTQPVMAVAGILVVASTLCSAVTGFIALRTAGDLKETTEELEAVQASMCESGNEFRSELLPQAFRQHDLRLAEAFQEDASRADEFSDQFEDDLRTLFPLRDCGS